MELRSEGDTPTRDNRSTRILGAGGDAWHPNRGQHMVHEKRPRTEGKRNDHEEADKVRHLLRSSRYSRKRALQEDYPQPKRRHQQPYHFPPPPPFHLRAALQLPSRPGYRRTTAPTIAGGGGRGRSRRRGSVKKMHSGHLHFSVEANCQTTCALFFCEGPAAGE